METVRLRTGSVVPRAAVTSLVMQLESLSSLGMPGLLARYDLRKLAADPGYRMSPESEAILARNGLLVKVSSSDVEKEVILASLTTEGDLRSPLA